jgi:hypothetical protein
MELGAPFGLPRQRGRKSAAFLAVPIDAATAPLEPPGRLTDAEREVWCETVGRRLVRGAVASRKG